MQWPGPAPEFAQTELIGEEQNKRDRSRETDNSTASDATELHSNSTASKREKGNSKRRRAEVAREEKSRPSRWKKDQSKMDTLESEADEKKVLTDEAELENRQLKLRTTAMVSISWSEEETMRPHLVA